MEWTPILPLADLPRGTMKARHGVLVVRLADDSLHAMENACPHQGYPLAQGTLDGAVITCCWHNFKFNAQTGACLVGEEGVQTHPLRVRDGVVEVQRRVTIDTRAAWASLAEAMARVQGSRAAREASRLLHARVAPAALLAWAAAWDADHGEWGPGHTVALAADLVGWLDRVPEGVDPLVHRVQIVAEALDLAARAHPGRPARARPAPEAPGEDAAAELRRRVEREDVVGAEALARGMVAAGWSRAALEGALYPLVADHFLDFGHPLIYLPKLFDLLDAAGPEHADALLGGWVFGVANGTREDLLPPWAGFRRRMAAWEAAGGPANAQAARRSEGASGVDSVALRHTLVHAAPPAVFDAVTAALVAGPWAPVLDALVLAGAERLLRFDPAHDRNPDVEEGWLDVTHRFTAAGAARVAAERWDEAEAARIVLMAAHFIALARPLDRAEAGGAGRTETGAEPNPTPFATLQAQVLAGRAARAIFFAHDVKTLAAAEWETARTGSALPMRAVGHYLGHPLQERLTRRFASEAVRLVRDGKPPAQVGG
jgi:nitrite reductase/ring-hydroxylating ferredoxin subunit